MFADSSVVNVTCQVNAAAVAFSFDWGVLMQTYLDSQDSISSIGVSYFEFACFGSGDASEKNSFVMETVTYILLPIVFICFTGLAVLLSLKCKKKQGITNDDDESLNQARTSALGVASITLFLLQPTLVKQFAVLFSCTRMGKDTTDLFLMEDLSIRCYSNEHWFLLATLGAPLFVLYVIGIPLSMYHLLSHPQSQTMITKITQAEQVQRQACLDDSASLETAYHAHAGLDKQTRAFETSYAFLFLGYKPELYLWEIAVLARKGSLSLIGVAFSTDPRTQVMLGMLVIFFSAITHARFMPFDDALMNTYEFISLFVSAMTFFIGVFTMETLDGPNGEGSDEVQEAATLLAFVINVMYVCAAVPIGATVRKKANLAKEIQKVN